MDACKLLGAWWHLGESSGLSIAGCCVSGGVVLLGEVRGAVCRGSSRTSDQCSLDVKAEPSVTVQPERFLLFSKNSNVAAKSRCVCGLMGESGEVGEEDVPVLVRPHLAGCTHRGIQTSRSLSTGEGPTGKGPRPVPEKTGLKERYQRYLGEVIINL